MRLSLWGYRPWTTDPEPPLRDGHENTWVRCRLSKFVSIINGLEPHVLLEGDFYLPWWFLCTLAPSLEDENPNWRAAVEIRVPQLLPETEPANK